MSTDGFFVRQLQLRNHGDQWSFYRILDLGWRHTAKPLWKKEVGLGLGVVWRCSPSSKTCLGGTRAEVTSSTGGGAPTPSSHRIRFFAPRSVLLPLLPLLPLLRFWRVSRCFMDLVSLLCLPVSARYSLIWGGGPKAKQEVEETLPVCTWHDDTRCVGKVGTCLYMSSNPCRTLLSAEAGTQHRRGQVQWLSRC